MTDTRQIDQLTPEEEHLAEPPDQVAQRVHQPAEPTDGVAQPGDGPPEQPARLAKLADRLTRKSQWSNWTVLAMIILCFFVIIRFRPFDSRDPQKRAGVGRRLQELELQPLTSGAEPVSLADLTGRVVLINVWQPRSPLCRDALAYVAEIEKEFHDRLAFKLLSVACRQEATEHVSGLRHRTQVLLRQKRTDMPVHRDSGRVTRSAIDQVVGLKGYPTTLILDRRGRIRGVWDGFRPGAEREMHRLIAQLLAEE